MKVFIDANNYLSLYKPPGDGSNYLKTLLRLKKEGTISLVFLKVTQHEVRRNIGSRKDQYHKSFEKMKANQPKLDDSVSKTVKEKIDKLYSEWIAVLEQEKKDYSATVDKINGEIFTTYKSQTTDYPEDVDLVRAAYYRKLKGYPPGKGPHLGDWLSWEILLKNCVDDDLVIISQDNDWRDDLNLEKSLIHPFLNEEWKQKTGKTLSLYKYIGDFLRKFPEGKDISSSDIENEKTFARSPLPIYPALAYEPASTPWILCTTPTYVIGGIGTSGPSVSHVASDNLNMWPGQANWCSVCNYYLGVVSFGRFCPNCGAALT